MDHDTASRTDPSEAVILIKSVRSPGILSRKNEKIDSDEKSVGRLNPHFQVRIGPHVPRGDTRENTLLDGLQNRGAAAYSRR